MPKKAKYELIRCNHFSWRLSRRGEVWQADGRSNPINVGRHSLGTRDKAEALKLLCQLDERRAVEFGLIEQPTRKPELAARLTLAEGRKLYEEHIARPRTTGGVKPTTRKRYRTTFNNFLAWAEKQKLVYFDQVSKQVLLRYAGYLDALGRSSKTLENELTTIKQVVRWLIDEGHLPNCEPIALTLRKFETQEAYCYRPQEVAAMLTHCRAEEGLGWIGDTIVGLACTGMRIGELVSLKWSDIDLEEGRITLTDETGHQAGAEPRRTLKNGRSRRMPIDAELRQVLEAMPRKASYVFLGPEQKPLKPDFVRRKFVEHVIEPLKAGFPATSGSKGFADGRLHSFRHYFVSQCAAHNVSELVIRELVGHADSAMVRRYCHVHEEEARRQMRGLDFLGGAGGRSAGNVSVSE